MHKKKKPLLERPRCPKCGMRMIAAKVASKTFECLRCGYVGESVERSE